MSHLPSPVNLEDFVVDSRKCGYSFPISSGSEKCQRWMDAGMLLSYGFAHEMAEFCFLQGAVEDPVSPMPWWGVAYSRCPNYNDRRADEERVRHCREPLDKALKLASEPEVQLTEFERGLLEGLDIRLNKENWEVNGRGWAESSRDLYQRFPKNAEAACLYAESLMCLHPWTLWENDEPTSPDTPEAQKALEAGLELNGFHPGLLHFWIHFSELSSLGTSAFTLEKAEVLRSLTKDCGHLIHMPTHIDVLLGDWEKCAKSNQDGAEADEALVQYFGQLGKKLGFYAMYQVHNVHFVMYAGMMMGNRSLAFEWGDSTISLLDRIGMNETSAFYLESFYAAPWHLKVRFGMWKEILEATLPSDPLFSGVRAWGLFAKGLAYAALGDVKEAKKMENEFLEAHKELPERGVNNSTQKVLEIGKHMLRGEILYRECSFDASFSELREAVRLDDALVYAEPWDWMQPARHALGALLLEQGRLEEAEEVYKKDLQKYPKNIWSLTGLVECLEGKMEMNAENCKIIDEEVKGFKLQLLEARRSSDSSILASCGCSQKVLRKFKPCCEHSKGGVKDLEGA